MNHPELELLIKMGPYWMFVMGLIWGSFYNVCIYRIPADQSVVVHSSRCPKCAAPILWYHNVPVIGFLFLKGKCYRCAQKISIQYPIIELVTGFMFLWLFSKFGFSWQLLGALIFCSMLLIISVIDLHHRIIPDELSLPGIVLGVGFAFLTGEPPWLDSILGLCLGGGVFFAVAWGYEKLTGREGLGGGDIKLLAMIGAWLGGPSILMVVILSSLVGTVVGLGVMLFQKKGLKTAIPFGPFLAGAALVYFQWGDTLRAFIFFRPNH